MLRMAISLKFVVLGESWGKQCSFCAQRRVGAEKRVEEAYGVCRLVQ